MFRQNDASNATAKVVKRRRGFCKDFVCFQCTKKIDLLISNE